MNRLYPPGVFAAALHKKNGGKCWHLLRGAVVEAEFNLAGTDTRSRFNYNPAEGEPVLGHAEGAALARVLLEIVAQTGRFKELFGMDATPNGTEASIDEAWDLQHALKGGLNDPVVRAVFPGGWEQKPEPPVLTTHFDTVAEMIGRQKIRHPNRFNPELQRQTPASPGVEGAPLTREMVLAWYALGADHVRTHPGEVQNLLAPQDYVDAVDWLLARDRGRADASTSPAAPSLPQLLRMLADELESSLSGQRSVV